ncbi:hypothetical protein [Comamonas sp. NLF-1-9]|uniref:hypothetical protein n=1 Tax=Comamonas sp. NLF-1-9 TaxID=2853163 RepID=UPI001C47378B|nr:hypothetical protein [Comamonas sp. NLF-1-9]QXL84791.1 hypothetical protein KUD94_02010 [Comamonas sp. NLF-1-9]
MAKPNYSFEKRQREREKKRKKEEKMKRKLSKGSSPETPDPAQPGDESGAAPAGQPADGS